MPDDYIQEGYIILARKIRKSPLWQSLKASHRLVMLEILLQAQFKDGEVARNGEIIFLKRGQLATSYQQLVDDIGDKDITIKVVRNAIDKLIKQEFLIKDEEKAKAKKGLLLTVLNYGFYQDPDNYKSQTRSETESKVEALSNRSESKTSILGKEEGKVENTKTPYVPTDNNDSNNYMGKVLDITRAKQGQSEGKARAINNNVNNLNNVNKDINQSIDRNPTFSDIEKKWGEVFGKSLRNLDSEKIISYLDDGMKEELLIEALEITSQAEYKTMQYFWGILYNWFKDEIRTIQDLAQHEQRRKVSGYSRGESKNTRNEADRRIDPELKRELDSLSL